MLTVEEIKKCIEEFKPEGFDYLPSKYNSLDDQIRIEGDDYACRYDLYDKTWTNFIYPLFLQRVIEGINNLYNNDNKDFMYNIVVDYGGLSVRYAGRTLEHYSNFDDEAKEGAIKFILEQLKKINNKC